MSQLKEQIKEKAIHTFLRYGFRSVTMDDLARELGMSKKTLYQNFANKEDLLNEVLESSQEMKNCYLDTVSTLAANPVEMVFIVFQYLLEESEQRSPNYVYDLKKYYYQTWERFVTANEQNTIRKIIDNLQAGKEEGLYRPEINETIIARLFYRKAAIFEDKEVFPEKEFDRRDLVRELLEYHLNGICTERGRELIPVYAKKYFNQP